MHPDPLQQPCPHLATSAEQHGDPRYTACDAGPGEPCHWSRRYDGVLDPSFHSERIEAALDSPEDLSRLSEPADPGHLRTLILDTGLV